MNTTRMRAVMTLWLWLTKYQTSPSSCMTVTSGHYSPLIHQLQIQGEHRIWQQNKEDNKGSQIIKRLTVVTAAARSPRKSSTISTCCRVTQMCTLPQKQTDNMNFSSWSFPHSFAMCISTTLYYNHIRFLALLPFLRFIIWNETTVIWMGHLDCLLASASLRGTLIPAAFIFGKGGTRNMK